MNDRTFIELLRKIVRQETKYNRVYDGKVVTISDGKVTCTIDSLGWDTEDKGAICRYIGGNSISDLTVDDYVKISFTNNDPAQAFILGVSNNYADMPVSSYDFEGKINTIYEDRNGNVQITKDENSKELKLFVKSGWKIIIENEDGNKIELGSSAINMNDGNHEVLQ